MRLYKNTTKRIAKKQNRHFWKKLNYAKNLKVGDLVSTCKGYNERIKEIYPEWTRHNLSKGRYIYDFDIVTESGGSCSVIHCCTFPLETKEQIIEYWNWFNTPEGKEWVEKCGWKSDNKIADALAEGIDPFDEDGQPLYEYCQDYEKKARFPEI